jgi:hypothetical protein
MDSFLREATAIRSCNYIKASGKNFVVILIFWWIGFAQMLMSAYNEDICIIVTDVLGINLETLRKRHEKLSVAVVCAIGIQMVRLRGFKAFF